MNPEDVTLTPSPTSWVAHRDPLTGRRRVAGLVPWPPPPGVELEVGAIGLTAALVVDVCERLQVPPVGALTVEVLERVEVDGAPLFLEGEPLQDWARWTLELAE